MVECGLVLTHGRNPVNLVRTVAISYASCKCACQSSSLVRRVGFVKSAAERLIAADGRDFGRNSTTYWMPVGGQNIGFWSTELRSCAGSRSSISHIGNYVSSIGTVPVPLPVTSSPLTWLRHVHMHSQGCAVESLRLSPLSRVRAWKVTSWPTRGWGAHTVDFVNQPPITHDFGFLAKQAICQWRFAQRPWDFNGILAISRVHAWLRECLLIWSGACASEIKEYSKSARPAHMRLQFAQKGPEKAQMLGLWQPAFSGISGADFLVYAPNGAHDAPDSQTDVCESAQPQLSCGTRADIRNAGAFLMGNQLLRSCPHIRLSHSAAFYRFGPLKTGLTVQIQWGLVTNWW